MQRSHRLIPIGPLHFGFIGGVQPFFEMGKKRQRALDGLADEFVGDAGGERINRLQRFDGDAIF